MLLFNIHVAHSVGQFSTISAESSTLDTHVTLWLGKGNVDNVDMQLCVCQSKIVQRGPMFSGSVSNVHWWDDAQQCESVARQCTYTGEHAVYWRGSPPVSWWRRPAVRGRLLRKRIGTQYRKLINIGNLKGRERKGKACVSCNHELAKCKKDEPVQERIARDLDSTVT